MAIQVTTAEGDVLTTESAFVAGKKNAQAPRHDAATVAKVGQRLGVDLANRSATELLGMPLLIHKQLMPKGVQNLVELYDECCDGFFGEDKPKQDYDAYRQVCREREARFEPLVQDITDLLIAEAPTISSRVQATERLHQLSQDHMVQQAVVDTSIDPRVFGPGSRHIIEARAYLEAGDYDRFQKQTQLATQTSVSSSCPTGMRSASGTTENADSSKETPGDCSFVSKECPKCHAKNVKTTISNGKIKGACGCSAKLN